MTNDNLDTSSAPTPEQRDTAVFLRSVIGDVFADRFLDFCRLCNADGGKGQALRATLPLAAHAMRELDSILRQYLRGPFGASADTDEEVQKKQQATEQFLRQQSYDGNRLRNALRNLHGPTHADEIAYICGRLGVAPDGEIAKAWLNLVENQAELTHRRSARELPVVDDRFRRDFGRPFQMVVREVAKALQRNYAVYMREVDKLATYTDKVKAVKQFRDTIPGTPPLQRRFFERIEGPGWLAPLKSKGMLRAPVPNLDDRDQGIVRYVDWAPALYLRRIAASGDVAARAQVAQALRDIDDIEEFGVRDKCFEVATALPSDEAAKLSDMAIAWLEPRYFFSLQAPEDYLKQLIKGKESAAVLSVARVLFGISRNEAGVLTRYERWGYEHSTPPFVEPITTLCGLDALGLYCDLLEEAATAKQLIKADPPGDYTAANDPYSQTSKAQYDLFASVAWSTRRCAEQLANANTSRLDQILATLVGRKYRIFLQLALLVATSAPERLGDWGARLLKHPALLGQGWCARDYGGLARAAFTRLPEEDQDAILREIDAIPDRDAAIWANNWAVFRGNPPTDAEMARIKLLYRREIFWHWHDVLPPARKAEIEQLTTEYGPPYGENDPRFSWDGQKEESPVSAADIVAKPVDELVAFLKSWKPAEDDDRLTVSALGVELRNAAEFDPQRFAAAAEYFEELDPHYLLRILEGLENQAKNQKPFAWGFVLVMLARVIQRAKATPLSRSAGSRDEPGWSWVLLTAASLLGAGLIEGPASISMEYADVVWKLIEALWTAPAIQPDDFASQVDRDGFFAAQATLRGSVLQAVIRYGYWVRPKGAAAGEGEERHLPAAVKVLLDQAVAFKDDCDSATPAIFGRYFDSLLFLDRTWTEANSEALLGAMASPRRKQLFWLGHLEHGRSTLESWSYFAPFVEEEIELVDSPGYNNDWRGKQFTQLLLYYYYWGVLDLEAGGLLARFLAKADATLREHGVWSLMHDLQRPDLAEDKRERIHRYYEFRVDAAEASSDRAGHRRELGMLGIWFGKNQRENDWMLRQLQRLASLKLTPPHPADFFTWLDLLMRERTDDVVMSLTFVVEDDGFDQWMFVGSGPQVRKILAAGIASSNPLTVARAKQIANVLVAKGQSDLFDLTQ